ncbi:T-DNA border endonuclease virD2 (plasmid) [Roseomonas mucosa]|uniref:relaxase/mobilization nuclease domain-containing protein n=1 Tax=Roseomonas mucosa TaxID=207340 RepID=UPI002247F246|nr:relaxase/mobilization nuclease domain-containing protein [Roseomonas mucosa]UZO95018.1 T-DNA border endonuclease virD2 [Roseomonas mucosa]
MGRIVQKTPEVMVKLTGRSRGGAGHLKAHLDYVTRNGKLHAETQDGARIMDRDALRALNDDWRFKNDTQALGRSNPNAAQSVTLILSMAPGTPPDRVEAAARTWARETFGGRYDYLMARHDDTKHPHVHVTVRAVGYDGKRLAPGPADLQQYRERFARELRHLGVEAEATPRQARGQVRKADHIAVHHTEQKGAVPRVREADRRAVDREARAPKPPQPRDWSRDIQARQESIRRAYLGHADELAKGDAADRRLAGDIKRFVADMPVPLTRRQALAVELREVLDKHPGRGAPTPVNMPQEGGERLHRANPSPAPEPRQDGPTRPKGRG